MLFRITFTSLFSPEGETIVASNRFSFSEWERMGRKNSGHFNKMSRILIFNYNHRASKLGVL